MSRLKLNLLVGIFILLGGIALFIVAFKMSNFSAYMGKDVFTVTAIFDNIGDLKVRAPVTISGVNVGEVANITLDHEAYKALVQLKINNKFNNLPKNSTAKILTAGVIGANYIELIPGYSDDNLQAGDLIVDTQSAIVIENLISKFLYSKDTVK